MTFCHISETCYAVLCFWKESSDEETACKQWKALVGKVKIPESFSSFNSIMGQTQMLSRSRQFHNARTSW